ncbi:MAG: hypothetical protein HY917_00380, partial [Candidatus Diapherotrites archaeon]|nr:hypothetical protein [Candidatus Diapherotrites archaeon]
CQYKAEDLKAAMTLAALHRLFDVRRIETILLQNIAQRDYFLPLSFDAQDYEHLPQFQDAGTGFPVGQKRGAGRNGTPVIH